ncbi:MAG: TonB-dependent receptor [Bacteroidetes bacterium]|nr:MAG: TonB-dependent receptor [Bacteroidota bacterium]
MKKFFVLIFFFTQLSAMLYGGEFKGKVFDEQTSEPLIGAVVYLENTKYFVATDFDGNFKITGLPVGKYTAQTQYVSYHKSEEFIFQILNDSTTIIHSFALKALVTEVQDVIVTAEHSKESDVYATKTQKNADNIINVISARTIEISPDITVANVMQRMPGISIEQSSDGDGRHAIIRGMDKRYNYTLINGIKIPSPENKNRYVPLDIFPAELVERIEVNNSLTPNMEGDAIGGSINMIMKNAPNKFMINMNLGSGYSQFYFDNKYERFDRGAINKKSPREIYGNSYFATGNDFTRSNLDFKPTTALPYALVSFSAGNRFFNKKLGILVAASYQNTTRGAQNVFFTTTTSVNNTPLFQDVIARRLYSNVIRSTAHTKIDYRFNSKHSIELYTAYMSLINIDSRISYDTSLTSTRTGPGTGKVTSLYRSRDKKQYIYNITLQGKHNFSKTFAANWSAVFSQAGTNLPDWAELKTFSTVTIDSTTGKPAVSPAVLQPFERIWQKNTDKDYSGYLNLIYVPNFFDKKVEVSVGGLHRHKIRDNYFNTYILSPVLTGNPPQFPQYTDVYSAQWQVSNPTGNVFNASNYTAIENITSAYWQAKINVGKLKVIGGTRTEHTYQSFNTNASELAAGKSGWIKYQDLLPSLHFTYSATEKKNLRFSVYKAISRPSYFEIVPYNIPASDNFGEVGNPYLKHTTALNYDLKYEWFPGGLNQLNLGIFYKDIKNPIEYGVNGSQIQPNNYGNAQNMGFEYVGVKYIKHWGISTNYTFTLSQTSVQLIKNAVNPTNGQIEQLTVNSKRPLQGQSKHIANVSLFYKKPKQGLNVQLAFVYTGRRIIQVSQFEGLDYWQRATSQLSFSVEKKISKYFEGYIKIQNILNTPVTVEINSPYPYAQGEFPLQKLGSNSYIVQQDKYGQTYMLGVKYKFKTN